MEKLNIQSVKQASSSKYSGQGLDKTPIPQYRQTWVGHQFTTIYNTMSSIPVSMHYTEVKDHVIFC